MTLLRFMRIEGDILLHIKDGLTHRYVSFLDISTKLGDIGAQSFRAKSPRKLPPVYSQWNIHGAGRRSSKIYRRPYRVFICTMVRFPFTAHNVCPRARQFTLNCLGPWAVLVLPEFWFYPGSGESRET